MPYKRKNSPVWWCSMQAADGSKKRTCWSTELPATQANFKAAKRIEEEAKLDARRIKRGDYTGLTFDQVMLDYIDNAKLTDKQKARDTYSLKHLYAAFSGLAVADIKHHTLLRYIDNRIDSGAAPGTVNKETGLLSRAINWVRKNRGYDIPNHTAGTQQDEGDGRIIWLTEEQAEKLIKAAAETKAGHLVDFIKLGLATGMRRNEILDLTWDRVDLKERLIYLGSMDQKNKKNGSIPINNKAYAALLARASFKAGHCPSSPWVFCDESGHQIKSVRRSFATAIRKAGLPEDYTPHVLRHTFITWLVQRGEPIAHVSKAARHSDIRMTMKYTHLQPEDVRKCVAALDCY